jgi:hypothetical protein
MRKQKKSRIGRVMVSWGRISGPAPTDSGDDSLQIQHGAALFPVASAIRSDGTNWKRPWHRVLRGAQ